MQENKTLFVKTTNSDYKIIIDQNLISNIKPHLDFLGNKKYFIITDSNVAPLYADLVSKQLNAPVLTIPAGEASKSWAMAEKITTDLLNQGCDRKSCLIALGGGVVGDLTGFCAGIINRGIDFIQIPTTLLSQTDSSVGGKTAINSTAGKNLIGLFYQPKIVLIDIDTLKTLPKREILAGYAEVAKYGLILDKDFWNWLKENGNKVIDLDTKALIHAIYTSCKTKADIVSKDEKETSGLRALLNYGHTYAHAFEIDSKFKFLHGEAVAMGCVYAAKLAKLLNISDLENEIISHFEQIGLPIKYDNLSNKDYLISIMKKDKKTVDNHLNFVILNSIGNAIVKSNVEFDLVKESLN
ncbi:MAG: 3-dehydroquinate synthase [Alphaproteobacteria bacterium]|nr:3-dehydroquinate synthase [Alphaproteobacteria bacterium]